MNTIRELKQQEKYKNMLKRKNKEKKIYKDKNASLQFEKHKLYIALLNREKEIERLNNLLKETSQTLSKQTIKAITLKSENKRLNNIINELERRFNQELENNEKWDIEDTKQFYSKKWYKDTLNDFKNMIKN